MARLTLDERIAKEEQKLKQLKAEKHAEVQRKKEKERAIETRRKIILGGMVVKYFPQFNELQPKTSKDEEYIEFEPFANFLKEVRNKENGNKTHEKGTVSQ